MCSFSWNGKFVHCNLVTSCGHVNHNDVKTPQMLNRKKKMHFKNKNNYLLKKEELNIFCAFTERTLNCWVNSPAAPKLTNHEWHPWKIHFPNEDMTLFFFIIFCSTVCVSLFFLIPSQTAVINTERSEALTSTLFIIKWKSVSALHRFFSPLSDRARSISFITREKGANPFS